jgi:hypothetical protein
MSTTLKQFFATRPRLEVATSNLVHNKKLRRLIAETIDKLDGSTSPRDLAHKVLGEITNTKSLEFLFGKDRLSRVDRQSFIYSHLEAPVKLSVERFTGLVSKSEFEANMTWQSAKLRGIQTKSAEGNPHIILSSQKDNNRVYVFDPLAEVCIVDNLSPTLLLDKEIEDRHTFKTPRTITFIKLDETKALMLFHAFGNGIQKRYIIPLDRVKSFHFKSLADSFIQDGLQIVPKELSGHEFDTNHHGEVVGEKRLGVPQTVYVFDQTNRGRKGDQGPKGPKGERGKTGAPGKSGNLHVLELLSKMKFTGPLGETEDPSIAVQFYRALSTVAGRELERQKKRGAK